MESFRFPVIPLSFWSNRIQGGLEEITSYALAIPQRQA